MAANAASRDQLYAGGGMSHVFEQLHVESGSHPHAREIQHDDCRHPATDGPRREDRRMLAFADTERPAASHVEAESNAISANGFADGREHVERRQRFEADHRVCRTERDGLARADDRGDPGIEPDGSALADRPHVWISERVCRVLNGVEISDVQLGDAAVVEILARELERVPDRLVTFANAAARVHRHAVANVNHADHSHRRAILADLCMQGKTVLGWDIGGVNTKVALVERRRLVLACARPFELQRAPDTLVTILRELASEIGAQADSHALVHAVTMTAELSQMFRTKREGVAFVLDAVEAAFPSAFPSLAVRVFTVDGRFVSLADARSRPLSVAAANWAATAAFVARQYRDAVLVDIGTTTADVIPIVGGMVVARGRTDPERLASGELVYTGALRTPAEAIVRHVKVDGEPVGVSAEGFALAGDVHVWRGDLAPADYTAPTPDRRPATREFAGERLARVICADREILDDAGVSAIADAIAEAQIDQVAGAIRRVCARHGSLRTAVVTGLGAFIAKTAACRAGLSVASLANDLGADAARYAPAAAVALLLDAEP
jgi:probable H4MPT-linked C1 transfer pathway protein